MLNGERSSFTVDSAEEKIIEADHLLFLPGLIDPHVVLQESNLELDLHSSLHGGFTTLIEPSFVHEIERKKKKVEEVLTSKNGFLEYLSYAKADLDSLDAIIKAKREFKGILLQIDPFESEEMMASWDKIFQIAAQIDRPIVINSVNENTLQRPQVTGHTLLEKALYYTEKYSARLYVLNVALKEEIDLIQKARAKSLLIFAETSTYHLFQMDLKRAEPLWEALAKGVIETVGTGYHLNPDEEQVLWKGKTFNLYNPLFFLPSFLTVYKDKGLSLEVLVNLMTFNIQSILEIQKRDNFVLVDLQKEEVIERTLQGRKEKTVLKGWPAFTISNGTLVKS